MSALDAALRALIRDEVRRVLREELSAASRRAPEPAPASPAAGTGSGPEEDFVSCARAAAIAGVRVGTVRSWVGRGQLRGYRAGRLLRVRRGELVAYLARTDGGGGALDLDERATAILRRRARPLTSTPR